MGNNLLAQIRKLSSKCKRMLDDYDKERKINTLYCVIIDYLSYFEKNGVLKTQRDIEKYFYLSKSTASDALNYLEENEYIKRVTDNLDQRKKNIVLLDKGKELNLYNMTKFKEVENNLLNKLSKKDQEKFIDYVNKLLD